MEVAVRGRPISSSRREFVEMNHYQSGAADDYAREFAQGHEHAWERVLECHEPIVPPAMRWLLSSLRFSPLVRGKVLDIAAGTCWTTALISRHPRVDEVWAFDMSERFLTTAGREMFLRWNGVQEKLRFAVGDFNALPFEDDTFDTAFLVACVHHSVTPFLTLTEAIRCVKRKGRIFILEHPAATINVRKGREMSLDLCRGAATEVCYTAGEFEYLFRRACLPLNGKSGKLTRHPFDSAKGWRLWVRHALRRSRLEDLLRAPLSVYEIEVQ